MFTTAQALAGNSVNDTKSKVNLGRRSEELVANRLREQGYRIIARNYRAAHGELDIVCQMANTLFVVEVRSRKHGATRPIETITPEKQRNIFSATDAFMAQYAPDVDQVRFIAAEVDWELGRPIINFVFDPFPFP